MNKQTIIQRFREFNKQPGGGAFPKASARIWNFVLIVTGILNSALIYVDLTLASEDFWLRIVWLRVFASIVLLSLSTFPLIWFGLWTRLYPPMLAAVTLMISAILSTIETYSESTDYHMAILQVMFALSIAPARFLHNVIILAIPVSTYYAIAGPAHFAEGSTGFGIFLLLGIALNRAMYRAFEERLQDTRNVAMADALTRAAHELKHPLVTLRIMATDRRDVPDTKNDPEKLNEFLRDVIQITTRALAVQQRIMLNARGGASGKLRSVMRQKVNLAELITEAVETFPFVVASERSFLDLEFHNEPEIIGDRLLLGNVIQNLVENALYSIRNAAPDEPRLRILLEDNGTEATIRVIDNGIGFPTDEAESIFRAGHSLRGSTGLGLAFSRDTVSDNGGSIKATAGPDGGAEFVIKLPLCRRGES